MKDGGNIAIKRIHDSPADSDGQRVLVDRLWPRGISKERAQLDHWLREIAPSDALRKQFGHHPDRWDDFVAAYDRELSRNTAVAELQRLVANGKVTLLYAARDTHQNNAVALRDWLLRIGD